MKNSKNYSLCSLVAALLVCASLAFAADKPNDQLAQTHLKAGVTCRQCHGDKVPAKTATPTKYPKIATKEMCLKCHGSYKELAAKTRGIREWQENPHAHHYGELECYQCHRVHQSSEYFCTQCHIELKVPAGWKKSKNPADEQ